jgi:thioredoxin 1
MATLVPGERLLVACLCAEWCGGCREYRPTFDALAARFAADAQFIWLDVEDEADALGDPDIDNFPTLLIARGDTPLFLGPVTPQPQTAERLLQVALTGDLAAVGASAAVDLVARVRRLSAR